MKNTCPFYSVFQVLKVILVKTWKIQPLQIFYFWSFLLGVALTSGDIIFQKFLELHSALSEKQIFSTNFPFLTN